MFGASFYGHSPRGRSGSVLLLSTERLGMLLNNCNEQDNPMIKESLAENNNSVVAQCPCCTSVPILSFKIEAQFSKAKKTNQTKKPVSPQTLLLQGYQFQ